MTPGSMGDPGNYSLERTGSMVRTLVLALALALGGGAPYFGGWVDLLQSMWAADQVEAGNHADPNGVTTYAGSHYDPNGSGAENDAGGMSDPNGNSAESDLGSSFDPNGATSESDAGNHFDPDG